MKSIYPHPLTMVNKIWDRFGFDGNSNAYELESCKNEVNDKLEQDFVRAKQSIDTKSKAVEEIKLNNQKVKNIRTNFKSHKETNNNKFNKIKPKQ